MEYTFSKEGVRKIQQQHKSGIKKKETQLGDGEQVQNCNWNFNVQMGKDLTKKKSSSKDSKVN